MADNQQADSTENEQEVSANSGPDVVIITGMSGAGRTVGLKTWDTSVSTIFLLHSL